MPAHTGSTDSTPFESIPALPLLPRIHCSFKTNISRPPVWRRLAILLQPILDSAPNVSELLLEMIEPGYHSWDGAHCDKTFKLIEELDEVLRGSVAQHSGIAKLIVRVKHNCNYTDHCRRRAAAGDWFRLAKERKKVVAIELGERVWALGVGHLGVSSC